MKFKIKAEDLKRITRIAKSILPPSRNANTLNIEFFADLELGIRIVYPESEIRVIAQNCTIDKSGKIVVAGEQLCNIVDLVDDDSVINFELENNNLTIKFGDSSYQLSTSVDLLSERKSLDELQRTPILTISSLQLGYLINKVIHAMYLEDFKPVLASIHFIVDGNKLTLEATDVYKFARVSCPIENKFNLTNLKSFAVYKDGIKKLQRILSFFEKNDIPLTVELYERILENKTEPIGINVNSPVFSSFFALIPEEYPKEAINGLIGSQYNHKITLDSSLLSKNINRLRAISDTINKAMVFNLDNDKIIIKSKHQMESSYGTEIMNIEKSESESGKNFTGHRFGVNGLFLLSVLDRFDQSTKVDISFSTEGPTKWLKFTNDTEPDFIQVIMPLNQDVI